MAQIYKNTGSLNPARSVFDLSYDLKGSCDMGMLIPTFCMSCCPGDIIEIGQELVMRFQPLVHPVLHEINAFTWTFFVPYRLIDEQFEEFISGGWNGESLPHGSHPISLPLWSGSTATLGSNTKKLATLWDYFGFSHQVEGLGEDTQLPIDYPLRSYNFIYNEFFRDENLEPEILYPYDREAVREADLGVNQPGAGTYSSLMGCVEQVQGRVLNETNLFWGNWEKEYFTTALPWQQRGPSPALPLFGTADIMDAVTEFYNGIPGLAIPLDYITLPNSDMSQTMLSQDVKNNTAVLGTYLNSTQPGKLAAILGRGNLNDPTTSQNLNNAWTTYFTQLLQNRVTGKVDLDSATAGDINDLRWAFQIQKFLERNARIGIRYVEILHGRYGQPLQDVRLDRPEYIGGSRSPIIVSEVLQTSESDTNANNLNQTGSMRGHGITADTTFIGKYHVREFGLIMTLMCVKPRVAYNSQGIDRQWSIKTPYDLITPEFVNLSEQAISLKEIWDNPGAWEILDGFQGRYDEYRTANSKTVGLMRKDLMSWHLARDFPTQPSIASSQFIKINPADTKRIFAVTDQHGLLYNFANVIKAVRPLPIIAEPGLIDHH
jgi:hypothetical protein